MSTIYCLLHSCFLRSTFYGRVLVVMRTVVRGINKGGKRRGMYVLSYRGCTTQILTWGPIADRSFRGLGRSVRSDRPNRSGPMYSVSVYNPTSYYSIFTMMCWTNYYNLISNYQHHADCRCYQLEKRDSRFSRLLQIALSSSDKR